MYQCGIEKMFRKTLPLLSRSPKSGPKNEKPRIKRG